MIIGVLGMQGNLEEHIEAAIAAMAKLGIKGSVEIVKDRGDLERSSCLIISGGESTTMWKLLKKTGLFEELRKYKRPIFGTCAGMILLAKSGSDEDSKKTGQEFLGKIDTTVNRNAFGRQKDSFATDVDFNGKKVPAVFIRAPSIASAGKGVQILSKYGGMIVAAKQGNILVTAFHPELTGDTSVHEYFLGMVS